METKDKEKLEALLESTLTVFLNNMEGDYDRIDLMSECGRIVQDFTRPKTLDDYFKITPLKELARKAQPWRLFWRVDEDGSLLDMKAIRGYDIEAERLHENDWIRHMGGKGWVDMNTFLPAYLIACKRAGIDEITIKTGW